MKDSKTLGYSTPKAKCKIFAIEGEWEKSPKSKLTILPALDLLEKTREIPFAYRTAATHQEFYHHLQTASKSTTYNTLYLAFHGTKRALWFEEGYIQLQDLGEDFADKFKGKNILIGSCQTGRDLKILEEFKTITGAHAVAAYRKDVDFFESLLLDIACLEALTRVTHRKKWSTIIEKEHSWLGEKTGLVVV